MDADLLESLSEKLYCGRPSSYHYTKALAESLVMHNAQNLKKANRTYQSAIVRPSIVTPTLNEPLPGWTNNVGLLLFRKFYCFIMGCSSVFTRLEMRFEGVLPNNFFKLPSIVLRTDWLPGGLWQGRSAVDDRA